MNYTILLALKYDFFFLKKKIQKMKSWGTWELDGCLKFKLQ